MILWSNWVLPSLQLAVLLLKFNLPVLENIESIFHIQIQLQMQSGSWDIVWNSHNVSAPDGWKSHSRCRQPSSKVSFVCIGIFSSGIFYISAANKYKYSNTPIINFDVSGKLIPRSILAWCKISIRIVFKSPAWPANDNRLFELSVSMLLFLFVWQFKEYE